jgi:transcriptional regulator with GAF, ATPase, and Fis domain
MDQFRAVEIKRDGSQPRRVELHPLQLSALSSPGSAGVRAYLVPQDVVARLTRILPAGSLSDRGSKKPARPLAAYFRRRSGLVVLHAGYTHPGQTERGVRAMLNALAGQRTTTTCVIALSDTLFDQLWQRAAGVHRGAPTSNAANDQAVLDLCPADQVPDALREAFVGGSPQAEIVRRRIVLAARSAHPVLIQGETGTGKEVVARQIHDLSGRKAESFFAINCGGIPGELLESELFGHRKGAFTGALRNKVGLWTLADQGTLFLDEVGDLSPQHQVKILRALETGCYRPVGGVKEVSSRARVIAATNRDLARMVADHQFREDLYYRLFTFRIRTPALREHPDDIPELAHHFWCKIAGQRARSLPRTVTDALKAYQWPGNARELRAFLINLFLLAEDRSLNVPLIRAVMQDRLGAAIPINHDQ